MALLNPVETGESLLTLNFMQGNRLEMLKITSDFYPKEGAGKAVLAAALHLQYMTR